MFNNLPNFRKGYEHFNSDINLFHSQYKSLKLSSINNHYINYRDFSDFDCKISRIIRDPRDLVVSGYFYHKKGAEPWCNIKNPQDRDFMIVNGTIPQQLRKNESYSELLNRLSKEEGLKVEMEFRSKHFASMKIWDADCNNIYTQRYEDILDDQLSALERIFDFYELSTFRKSIGLFYANKYTQKNSTTLNKNKHLTEHMRNPIPGQWKEHFTSEINRTFNDQYSDILSRYNYL